MHNTRLLLCNKISLAFLLGMFSSIGKAQNWELFPLNQLNYFSSYSDSRVTFLVSDSSISNTNQKISYFNLKSKASICPNVNLRENTNTLSHLVSFKDSAVFYFKNASYPIFFNDTTTHYFQASPRIPKSSSRFIEEAVDTILGFPDSIRKFELSIDGFTSQVIWSKRFGVTSFVNPSIDPGTVKSPFTYTLIGLELNGQNVGYKPQKSNLYFPYQNGDILFWKSTISNFMNSPTTYSTKYIRDSILVTFKMQDSIGYLSNRSVYELGQTTTYLFKQMIPVQFVEQPADDACIGRRYIGSNYTNSIWIVSPLVRNTSLNDTIETREFITGFNSIDLNTCITSSTLSPYAVTLRSDIGLSRISGGTYISYKDELISWRIGNNHYGSVEFPVGVDEINYNSITLFPNPAHETLRFKGMDNFSYDIKNTVGKTVASGFAEYDNINISVLPNGVYFINIISDKTYRPIKFIKN
ncbi:MAG: T9SS type A sorting domain-containing protein [Bacteroidia bacterium]|nr:T9SS type A sorting domain-containing protein [Bacteroidia bacterium]MBP7261667.1 T9SS type A sorting domain-containing protein [Bacteroidia bacterium]MBP9179032.1 T9SS type A sorting domain-containing protein [Bacteroidia bacterium]MBP9725420.1 T9SS type A sorting domain-containing protein [Bacteroidia bacterium]